MRSLLLLACLACLATVAAASDSYVVALAQHEPAPLAPWQSSLAQIKAANLDSYTALAQTASSSTPRPDLLLFPEFGLSGKAELSNRNNTKGLAEPLPECPAPSCENLGINPSADPSGWCVDSPAFCRGSVLARANNVHVLLNLFEQLPCDRYSDPACPLDWQYVFVTSVLFNASGTLVAKYRKSHPFYVPAVNAPPKAELVYYDAPFGVRVGLFICADIAFEDPAVQLVQAGVRHFAYAAAIGTIGRDTLAPAWSALYNSTLLLANNGADSSAVFVAGEALPTQVLAVPNSADSVLLAKVSIGAGVHGEAAAPLKKNWRAVGEKLARRARSVLRGA